MAFYDVFNGDADGICALQQLRLEHPRASLRVSGLKRDIDLLNRVEAAAGDEITVLDVSLDKNRVALDEVLTRGATVFYADHHFPGDIPQHANFECHIDVAADTCTSLIINRLLDDAHARWAVVGAFGDNFDQPARELGESIGLGENLAIIPPVAFFVRFEGHLGVQRPCKLVFYAMPFEQRALVFIQLQAVEVVGKRRVRHEVPATVAQVARPELALRRVGVRRPWPSGNHRAVSLHVCAFE